MPVYFSDRRKGLVLIPKDIAESSYLAHYGIKGQKWGKRRWQNEDGSLTPEGYVHYGIRRGPQSKEAIKYDKKSEKLDKINWKIDRAEKNNKNTDRLKNKRDKILKQMGSLTKEDISAKLSEYEHKSNDAIKAGLKESNKRLDRIKSLPDGPEKGKEIEKILEESAAYSQKRSDNFFRDREDGYTFNEAHMLQDVREKIDPKSYELNSLENWLSGQISDKSGDWYNTEGVSKGFRKITDEINDLREKSDEIYNNIFRGATSANYKSLNKKYEDNPQIIKMRNRIGELIEQIPEQVLRDLNVPVTKDNLERIRPFVFWD